MRAHLQLNSPEVADSSGRINFLAVAWGMNTLAYSIIYPFLPVYFHNIRGIPMSTVGLMYPIMGIAVIIGSPLSGVLTDRVGRRALLIGGPLGRSLTFFSLAVMAAVDAPFPVFALGLFFSTLLGGCFQNAANAYITDITSPEDRPQAFSKVRVGLNVGWMLGPALGSFLSNTPFEIVFCVTATLGFLTAGIPYKFCPPVPLPHAQNEQQQDSLFAILRHDASFVLLLLFSLCLYASVSQFVSTLTIYSTNVVGIQKTSLGFLYTINGALVIAFLIPLNAAIKQVPLAYRMGSGAFLYVAAYLGFGLSQCWSHLALWMIVMTGAEMIALTAVIAAVSQIAPPRVVGRYMGMHGLVHGLGWALGPYLGAVLFERVQSQPLLLWACLASGAFLAGLGYTLCWKPPETSASGNSSTLRETQ